MVLCDTDFNFTVLTPVNKPENVHGGSLVSSSSSNSFILPCPPSSTVLGTHWVHQPATQYSVGWRPDQGWHAATKSWAWPGWHGVTWGHTGAPCLWAWCPCSAQCCSTLSPVGCWSWPSKVSGQLPSSGPASCVPLRTLTLLSCVSAPSIYNCMSTSSKILRSGPTLVFLFYLEFCI